MTLPKALLWQMKISPYASCCVVCLHETTSKTVHTCSTTASTATTATTTTTATTQSPHLSLLHLSAAPLPAAPLPAHLSPCLSLCLSLRHFSLRHFTLLHPAAATTEALVRFMYGVCIVCWCFFIQLHTCSFIFWENFGHPLYHDACSLSSYSGTIRLEAELEAQLEPEELRVEALEGRVWRQSWRQSGGQLLQDTDLNRTG